MTKESGQYCRKKELSEMKRKSSIGLSFATVIMIWMVSFGYYKVYQHAENRLADDQKTETLVVQGEAVKEQIFYLKELNGYVAVYLEDEKTLYEYTDIKVEDLPEEIQGEIRKGKKVTGFEKVYGFLENYSS